MPTEEQIREALRKQLGKEPTEDQVVTEMKWAQRRYDASVAAGQPLTPETNLGRMTGTITGQGLFDELWGKKLEALFGDDANKLDAIDSLRASWSPYARSLAEAGNGGALQRFIDYVLSPESIGLEDRRLRNVAEKAGMRLE